MSREQKETMARLRVDLIVKVLSRQMTAREAAKQLGISRKTYYKWEKRFLSGALGAVSDQAAGRPVKKVDEEKVRLQEQLNDLEKQVEVLKQTVRIRDVLTGSLRKGRGIRKRRQEEKLPPVLEGEAASGPPGGPAAAESSWGSERTAEKK